MLQNRELLKKASSLLSTFSVDNQVLNEMSSSGIVARIFTEQSTDEQKTELKDVLKDMIDTLNEVVKSIP